MPKIHVEIPQKTRLDKFLVALFKDEGIDLSRVAIQRLIEQGHVQVNGQNVNASFMLKPNDELVYELVEIPGETFEPENIPLTIIYEDEDLVVVDKPNDMVVHPALGNTSGTLANGLAYHFKELSQIGGTDRPGIVHRLDKQTTGLLIVAKNDATHRKLSDMFAHHEIKKTYLALVTGEIDENEAIIHAPIGRHPNDRKKMTVTANNAKDAMTKFTVLERFAHATLVAVQLETGRTHQIRVHFQYINHPVLNDPQYGPLRAKTTPYGQYLHAWKLDFIHPTTGKQMHFESAIPLEFNDKIEELRNEV